MKSESHHCHAPGQRAPTLHAGLALSAIAAIAAAGALYAPSAFAELGGTPTMGPGSQQPVQQVQRVVAASRKADNPAAGASAPAGSTTNASTVTSAWSMREVTQADGLVEREYLTADGVVFAVAWNGPHRPELSVLLGTRYATQMARNARVLREQGKGSHRATSQVEDTFVVQAATHQRSSTGVAWLPQLLPAGLNPAALSIAQGT